MKVQDSFGFHVALCIPVSIVAGIPRWGGGWGVTNRCWETRSFSKGLACLPTDWNSLFRSTIGTAGSLQRFVRNPKSSKLVVVGIRSLSLAVVLGNLPLEAYRSPRNMVEPLKYFGDLTHSTWRAKQGLRSDPDNPSVTLYS